MHKIYKYRATKSRAHSTVTLLLAFFWVGVPIAFVFISCLMVVLLASYDSFGNLRRMTFDINVERLAEV